MPYVLARLEAAFDVHQLPAESAGFASLGHVRGVAMSGSPRRMDGALMDLLPSLEVIANFGVGYDAIDVAAAASRGITVTNTPDVLTDEVADLTIALLLATIRQLPQAERYLRDGKWLERAYPLTPSLRTRSVGIVGLGRIGKAVAHRLTAFGVPIAYHGRNRQADVPYRYYPSLVAMAEDVDTLVSVVPGGAATHHLINAGVLKALGPQGIVVNVGRGSVVDEMALIAALRDKTILSAGLDVFEHGHEVNPRLRALSNVVLLPHMGSATLEGRVEMGEKVIINIKTFADGHRPPDQVVPGML